MITHLPLLVFILAYPGEVKCIMCSTYSQQICNLPLQVNESCVFPESANLKVSSFENSSSICQQSITNGLSI